MYTTGTTYFEDIFKLKEYASQPISCNQQDSTSVTVDYTSKLLLHKESIKLGSVQIQKIKT